jgi:hypothetical protein
MWWNQMGHINGSDAVAEKCQPSSTLADPLQKKINGNIINSIIPYDGLGKYKPCLP